MVEVVRTTQTLLSAHLLLMGKSDLETWRLIL